MKKLVVICLLVCILSGCGAVETFETLGNVDHVATDVPQARQVICTLPMDAALEAAAEDTGMKMYSTGEYTLILQTLSAGDLTETIRSLSGFAPEDVTMLESVCGDHIRYDWAWTAVSGEGELVCRGAVLDDGHYHYALTVMAPADRALQLQQGWNALFGTFCLEN